MFTFIKTAFQKIYSTITSPLQKIFATSQVDQATLQELEKILIQADTGLTTSKAIIGDLQKSTIRMGTELKSALRAELLAILQKKMYSHGNCSITLLVGINGSGKTTCAGKLAAHYTKQGMRVLIVAADTFRAAAQAQLQQWAQQAHCDIFEGAPQAEPASVVFQGCKKFLENNYDHMIIDTAGRLQTKVNLMNELAKIRRIIAQQLPETSLCTLLTIDGMLGQNSFAQAQFFHEATPLDGIILTKMDGSGKGGIVFAITQQLNIPIAYLSYGETIDAIMPFDAKSYVDSIIGDE